MNPSDPMAPGKSMLGTCLGSRNDARSLVVLEPREILVFGAGFARYQAHQWLN